MALKGDKILAQLHDDARLKVDKVYADLFRNQGPSTSPAVQNNLRYGWGGGNTTNKDVGDKITAGSFNQLIDRLNIAVENTGLANVELDRQLPANQKILTAYYNAINDYASNVLTVPNTLSPARASIQQLGAAERTANWRNQVVLTFDSVFPSYDEARHFFNSGSTIRMDFEMAGNGAGQGYRDWQYMFYRAGIVSYGVNGLSITGVAHYTNGNVPFVQLTSDSYQLVGTIQTGGCYGGYGGYGGYGCYGGYGGYGGYGDPLYIRIYSKLVGTQKNIVRFRAVLDNTSNAVGEKVVNGTTQCFISRRKPVDNSRPSTTLIIPEPDLNLIGEFVGT